MKTLHFPRFTTNNTPFSFYATECELFMAILLWSMDHGA